MRLRLTQKEIAVINRAFENITQVDFADLTEEHHDFCNEVAEPLRQKILDQFDLTPEKESRIRIDWSELGNDIKTTWVYETELGNSLLGAVLLPVSMWEFLKPVLAEAEIPIYLDKKGAPQAEIYSGLGQVNAAKI